MRKKPLRLGEMLVNAGLISEEELQHALVDSRANNLKLGQQIVRQGTLKEEEILTVLGQQMNLELYTPNRYTVEVGLSAILPADLAMKFKVAPLQKDGHLLKLAMNDPLDLGAIDAVEVFTNCEVEPVICSEKELGQLSNSIYGMAAGMDGVIDSIQALAVDEETAVGESDEHVGNLQDMAEEAPVIRLVNSLLSQAVREGASDVHISPEQKSVQIRFRIDGKLKEYPAPSKNMILPIISRVKILAKMDIAITRIPQDGRFTVIMENREINIRVSTLPTIYGENLVMRLLDMSSGGLTLSDLGMSTLDMDKIHEVIIKPHGMILSTGPTGSGKSTSLYAILREINRPDINIITLEDPVEYRLANIRQVQLNTKAGMTFVSGLRSILRQDPDVIMVGEIRDGETANIATQAALTGHRVFSTVHTNNAAGAVTRLIDMGIEPFLVASVLLVSFAQRLVRSICPQCKESYRPSPNVLKAWGMEEYADRNFMRGKGCYYCGNTGYKGRTGLFEVLLVDDEIQELILERASASLINQNAISRGVLHLLRDDAKNKILSGKTTFEEAASAVMV
ncbi:GspE/PulE family protein [Desulfovibrio inopinatus]|uniref:GspE/PulE family protein n=1 Tax=Desulfovibrio inopinatus TaxID=102109 RepID=UPI0003FDC6E2|nr:ATPase, T2SS/T4P/T4SS family [Desulfovibrio inopinatus]